MSSEAETKEQAGTAVWRSWWAVILAFTFGCLLGSMANLGAVTSSTGVLPTATPHPTAQESPHAFLSVQDKVAAGPDSNCDIPSIHLDFDIRHKNRSDVLRSSLQHRHYLKFEEIYKLVVNKEYSPFNNIWQSFPNAYHLNASFKFPYSNLRKPQIEKVIELVGKPIELAVEVGSFHGHSAIWQALVLDQHGFKETPLLCIDPWTGALGQLLNRDDWDKKLTPGEIADGRSTSYWQFMLNIQSQILQKTIGPKHIIPVAVTSIVGARFLMALDLTPDMIFLDSAHEVDETFIELSLFYKVLAPGGVVFGDDFSWDGVQHDVTRFAMKHKLKLETSPDGVIWMLKKPLAE